jgi:hypothetical protein
MHDETIAWEALFFDHAKAHGREEHLLGPPPGSTA